MVRLMERLIDTREVVVAFVPRYAKGRTLDIGGGTSKYRSIIEPVVSEYIVADLYDPAADYQEDVRRMSFPNDSFDTVLSFQVLEHVDDTTASIREIFRVLKRGGCAIITIPFLFPEHGDPSDFHRFTLEGARYHVKQAGFAVLEAGTQGSTWSVVSAMLRTMFLNQYAEGHGKLRRAVFTRILFPLLKRLDKASFLWDPNLYTNVYIVAQKS